MANVAVHLRLRVNNNNKKATTQNTCNIMTFRYIIIIMMNSLHLIFIIFFHMFGCYFLIRLKGGQILDIITI